MNEDARFEDSDDKPLALSALDGDDLQVISALVQDAVLPASEMSWDPARRRFALLLNRCRWEDEPATLRRRGNVERVQSVLLFGDVLKIASQGITRKDPDTILSLLAVDFHTGADGTGRVELIFAGDGAIALDVEALDVTLKDVTRPYVAPSQKKPTHE